MSPLISLRTHPSSFPFLQSASPSPIPPAPTHASACWRAPLPTSCGYLSPSSLRSFLLFLVPSAAATSPPFPSFPLSFHERLHYLVLVDSLPALFKLVLGLGQVSARLPLLSPLLLSPAAGQMLLSFAKVTIPFPHNGDLCVGGIPVPETAQQAAYHTNFACLHYSIRMSPQPCPETSTLKALLWSLTCPSIRKALLGNRTPEESVPFLSGALQCLIRIWTLREDHIATP